MGARNNHQFIHSLVVGDEQELSFAGEVFYRGSPLTLLQTLSRIREHFHVGLQEASSAWKQAIRETVR